MGGVVENMSAAARQYDKVRSVHSEPPLGVLRVIARLNIGGPAIQAVSLTRELEGPDFHTVLVCGDVEAHEGDMSFLARDMGVRPLKIDGLGREISPVKDLGVLVELLGLIGRARPAIIHTHTAKAGTLGRMAGILWNLFHGKRHRVRLVHTFHGHVFHSYFSRGKTAVFLWIERFLARSTDRVVVISPAQKADICHTYRIAPPRKVVVVPLGFDLKPFAAVITNDGRQGARRDLTGLEHPGERFIVGFVGRLAPVKNPQMLISGILRLQELGRAKGFLFVLVGDGELRESLERELADSGVKDLVVFAGWREHMAPVYGALDAVVLTSLNEGTPVAVIEAMAAGRPVVATAVGGVPDLLGEVEEDLGQGVFRAERGLLIPSGDDQALASALVYLRDHVSGISEITRRAREYALSAYGLERLVNDVKGLYRDLIGNGEMRGGEGECGR